MKFFEFLFNKFMINMQTILTFFAHLQFKSTFQKSQSHRDGRYRCGGFQSIAAISLISIKKQATNFTQKKER